MAGKNCVGICSDLRLGAQALMVDNNCEKVFQLNEKVMIGLAGLRTDALTFSQIMNFRLKLFKQKEQRDMPPEMISSLVSTLLYEKRFGPYFTEPVIAGLDDEGKPFISAMDLIGAPVFASDSFAVSGTCTSNMHGACEAFFRPNLEPEELFEVLSQCLLTATERDALSGWGAIVHIITPNGVITRKLKSRQD